MSARSLAAPVLAAGSSKRFGPENKLLADVGGRSVIESVLSNVNECGFDVVVVVIASDQPEVETLVQSAGFISVVNPQAASGMGSSIACGMKHLLQQETESYCGVAIYLGDMPSISSDISRRLLEEFKAADGQKIVRPTYTANQKDVPGHPVIFPTDLFVELAQLAGDSGAKQLVVSNHQRLIEVGLPDPGVKKDIDYPSDISGQ